MYGRNQIEDEPPGRSGKRVADQAWPTSSNVRTLLPHSMLSAAAPGSIQLPFPRVQVSVGAAALAIAWISTQKPATTPVPPQPSSTSERAVAAAEHAVLPGTAIGRPAPPSVISSLDQEAKKSSATYWDAK